MSSDFSTFIVSQIWNAPFFLLNLVGIVLALTRWPRHPTSDVQINGVRTGLGLFDSHND